MEPNADIPNNISTKVDDNLAYLKDFFGNGINLIQSRYEILKNQVPAALVYIDTVADKELIMNHLVKPLFECSNLSYQGTNNILLFIKSRIISATETKQVNEMSQVVEHILNGDTVLFIEQTNAAIIVGTRKVEKRPIEPPENESTILGSQESFTDDLKVNCSLILKRLPVPILKFEEFTVGTLSCTKVKLIWLEGVANTDAINEARRRIQSINIDQVDGIGVLSELIEDRPISLFPKYRQTERPDMAARALTNGRFVIISSNSPFAFIAPITLWESFKTMDDYEDRFLSSSYLRITRYIAFLLSIFISAIYLSFVTYNQQIVPQALALDIAAGREGVALPSVLEMLLLTFAITIIREAGLRMPSAVGYFVGTLSAVIIGQVIVTAGYFSAALIIVVAVCTISSFAISTTTMLYPARLLNFAFIILAGCFGMFGVICGISFLFWYLCTLESFGLPYLYPLIPYDKNGLGDVFVRSPLSTLKKRMKSLAPKNQTRSGARNQ